LRSEEREQGETEPVDGDAERHGAADAQRPVHGAAAAHGRDEAGRHADRDTAHQPADQQRHIDRQSIEHDLPQGLLELGRLAQLQMHKRVGQVSGQLLDLRPQRMSYRSEPKRTNLRAGVTTTTTAAASSRRAA
jgi:hypothetical protein